VPLLEKADRSCIIQTNNPAFPSDPFPNWPSKPPSPRSPERSPVPDAGTTNHGSVYTGRIYCKESNMATARVFKSGNSQAVRLPKEFRVKSKELEIFRRGDELVLKEKAVGMERVRTDRPRADRRPSDRAGPRFRHRRTAVGSLRCVRRRAQRRLDTAGPRRRHVPTGLRRPCGAGGSGWDGRHYWFAPRMLLLCDCGGSNGYRQLRFKEELCPSGYRSAKWTCKWPTIRPAALSTIQSSPDVPPCSRVPCKPWC